jgi:hypothetical protein
MAILQIFTLLYVICKKETCYHTGITTDRLVLCACYCTCYLCSHKQLWRNISYHLRKSKNKTIIQSTKYANSSCLLQMLWLGRYTSFSYW